MEPVSTTTGAWARIADALKDWPFWLCVALALSLTALVLTPRFYTLLRPTAGTAVQFAAVVAWVLAVCGAAAPIAAAFRAYRAKAEARTKFVVTPIEQQCVWGVAKQSDGSFVTQVTGHFLVKNRTSENLYLVTSKLIRPKIKGEVLPGLLTMQAPDSDIHGTACVSGHFIPSGATIPVVALILIRGVPKQKSGTWSAILEVADANAHKQRVPLKLRCFDS